MTLEKSLSGDDGLFRGQPGQILGWVIKTLPARGSFSLHLVGLITGVRFGRGLTLWCSQGLSSRGVKLPHCDELYISALGVELWGVESHFAVFEVNLASFSFSPLDVTVFKGGSCMQVESVLKTKRSASITDIMQFVTSCKFLIYKLLPSSPQTKTFRKTEKLPQYTLLL